MIQGYFGRFSQRLPQNDPLRLVFTKPGNVCPTSLYQQDISRMHFFILQVLQQVVTLALNSQYINAVILPESGSFYRFVYQIGSRQQQDFGNAYLLKIETFIRIMQITFRLMCIQ